MEVSTAFKTSELRMAANYDDNSISYDIDQVNNFLGYLTPNYIQLHEENSLDNHEWIKQASCSYEKVIEEFNESDSEVDLSPSVNPKFSSDDIWQSAEKNKFKHQLDERWETSDQEENQLIKEECKDVIYGLVFNFDYPYREDDIPSGYSQKIADISLNIANGTPILQREQLDSEEIEEEILNQI